MSSNTEQRSLHRPYAPSRRSVIRASAWGLPAVSIAVAAPAYACSTPQTVNYTLDWGVTAYTKQSADLGTATVVAPNGSSATPVTMTIASSTTGAVTRDALNLTVGPETNIGNLGASVRGLTLHHASPATAGRANRQTATFTFSRPVSGLSFTITDIDSLAGGWDDAVELSGSRTFTVNTYPHGSKTRNHVINSGVLGSPWRYYSSDVRLPNTGDNRGNVSVNYAAPLTSITMVYWSFASGANQRIWLSDFTFSASSC